MYKRQVFPSTNGEGSLIFEDAYRSRDSRLPLPEIKISLSFLPFEASRWVDLVEIYPLNNIAGAPVFGTGSLGSLDNRCVFDVFKNEKTKE